MLMTSSSLCAKAQVCFWQMQNKMLTPSLPNGSGVDTFRSVTAQAIGKK